MKIKNLKKNNIPKKLKSNAYFPILSMSPDKTFYNQNMKQDLNLSNKNSELSNSLNNSFILRNYQSYLNKTRRKASYQNANILSQIDLETILFNLKKNYNLITTVTQQGNVELDNLSNTLKIEEEKLNKLIDFKEIELPEEKISLRKLGDTNMTKEQLRNQLFELLNEKRSLDEKVNIANEYTKTVEHMIVVEKKKLRVMLEENNDIQDKLNNYEKYNLLINENLEKTKIKNNNYLELSSQLQKNIDLANKIISDNNEKNKILENRIVNKEEKVDNLKQTIDFMRQRNKEDLIKYKEDHYEKIMKSKEDQEEKIKKEKKYIDIIYCLYVLQKYFIKQESFIPSLMKKSKEYNSIINSNYDISIKEQKIEDNSNNLDQTNKLMDDSSLNESSKYILNSLNKSNKDFQKRSTANKRTSLVPNVRVSKLLHKSNNNVTLSTLKDILKQINIKKDEIFDYISKLSANLSLYQFNLNNLHGKEISLNDKKHNYFERVKKIISDNFLNFEELTKNNSKFKSFLEKNELFINEMKIKNRENNLNEINKRLNVVNNGISNTNETNLSNQLTKEEREFYENEKKKKLLKEQLLINANESYKKANDLILKMSFFFDNILEILNNISITIQNNILKSSKLENDENLKKNFTDFLNAVEKEKEQIVEFKKLDIKNTKNDSSFFVDYIKKLVEYNKNHLKDKLNEEDVNKILLKIFYYEDESKNGDKINELAFNQFISSNNISNQYDIFYHFHILLDQTMNIIKSILLFIQNNEEFIKNYESKSLASDRSAKSLLANQNSSIYSIISNAKAQIKASNLNSKKFKIVNKQFFGEKEKNDDYESVWVEDKDTSLETKEIKSEEKLFKKKFNHIENNIMNHLYKPSFEKTTYLRRLNMEMKNIKNLTFNNSKYNFYMNQKKNEIDLMSKQMLLYNNPGIHPNDLSNPMYNNINSMMVQRRRFNGKVGKRVKSTMMKKRTKYNL